MTEETGRKQRKKPWRRSERAKRNEIIWQDLAQRFQNQGYTPKRIWRSRQKLIISYNVLLNLFARATGLKVEQIEKRVSTTVARFLFGMALRKDHYHKATIEALQLDDPAWHVDCPHCGKVVPVDALPDPDGVGYGSLAPIITDTRTDKDKAQAAAMIEAGTE